MSSNANRLQASLGDVRVPEYKSLSSSCAFVVSSSQLTLAEMLSFFGILGVFAIPVMGDLPGGSGVTHFIADTITKQAIVGHVVPPDAVKQGKSASLTIEVPSNNASSTFLAFVAMSLNVGR